jgi:outer membrane autotransporter protein
MLAALSVALAAAWPVAARAQAAPGARASSIECPDPNDAECIARKKAEQEAGATPRPADGGLGVMVGGVANNPCVGSATGGVCAAVFPKPIPRRGPLTVRRFDFSAGIDHALSERWAVGGLVGLGRGRLHRFQTGEAWDKDTTIRTHSATLAGTLSWFPVPDVSIDATLAYQRTSFDFERVDSSGATRRSFFGDNAGRSWGLLLSAGTAWRGDGVALLPQVGLDYVASRVDPLNASIPNPPAGSVENFQVAARRADTLSGLLGLQAQWPRSVSFGTVTPYVRASWRERLAQSSPPVVVSGSGPDPREADLEVETSRRAATLAAGALTQLSGGISLFGDLGYTRGTGNLRETRLSVGFKLER